MEITLQGLDDSDDELAHREDHPDRLDSAKRYARTVKLPANNICNTMSHSEMPNPYSA